VHVVSESSVATKTPDQLNEKKTQPMPGGDGLPLPGEGREVKLRLSRQGLKPCNFIRDKEYAKLIWACEDLK